MLTENRDPALNETHGESTSVVSFEGEEFQDDSDLDKEYVPEDEDLYSEGSSVCSTVKEKENYGPKRKRKKRGANLKKKKSSTSSKKNDTSEERNPDANFLKVRKQKSLSRMKPD
ncbi:unnamed protein product [Acanthoscelides obtectus]|uniref:Uncharacterized protein n=1 Tax=Acanthoscelides obtectus TaxID=200917 RepID=A0A9P0KBB9_ACAOB|nr:unnamed protein product [Acanthoscelides obtectus]CAK1633541.1 hypothetical protein AOBTE_LOCUS8210 [Acanthoscelides obtectus]